MLMAKKNNPAPLADQIADVIEESGVPPRVAAGALALLLGSVCREGNTDLRDAVEIAKLASETEVKPGGRRGS